VDWGNPVLFLRAQDGALFLEPSHNGGAAAGANGSPAPQMQIGEVGAGAMVVTGPVSGVVAQVISGTVIDDVMGDVYITQASPTTVQPPPAPDPPPVPGGFVGREQELAAYAETLQATGSAIITGMPGLGKTALAAVLALRMSPPHRIFWHTFHAGEGLDTLLWNLAGFVAWHGNDSVWRLRQIAHQPPPPETLVVSLLQALRGQGFLLCLDDIQFVEDDPALAAAARRLTQALDPGDLRLIATADRLPESAESAAAQPLGGMSLADTRLLLDSRKVVLDDQLCAALQVKTGGNVELLGLAANALQGAANPRRLIDRLAQVENIGQHLLNEVDKRLSDAEREVMGALAVLGAIASKADAVEAILDGKSPRRTLLALSGRYLVISQLYAAEPGAEIKYVIAPILQSFYYDNLGRRERQAMHARAGAYFEQENHNVLQAAQHFADAGEMAHAARLAVEDGHALINLGHGRALNNLLERFESRQLEPLIWVHVKLAQGQVARLLGDYAAVQKACEEALRTLDGQPPSPEVHLLRARACRGRVEALEFEDPQAALTWLDRGLAALAALQQQPATDGSPPPTPDALEEEARLHILAVGLRMALGDYDAALAAAKAAIEQLPPEEEALLAYNYNNLGAIHSYQGNFHEAARYYALSLEIDRRLHDDLHVLAVLNNMGIDKEIAGDWDGAAADYREALHLAHQLESVVDQVRIGNSLAVLNIRRGDHVAAEQGLTHAIATARALAVDEGLMYLLHTQAELEIAREEWDAAARALAEADQLAEERDAPYVLVEILISLAQVTLARYEISQASTHVKRALALAEELELVLEKGKALRVLGQVRLASGDTSAALDAIAQSVELLQDAPYEAARTKAIWGAAARSMGDEQCAVLLQEAIETFAELGAQVDHARAVVLSESSA
jgi:tetratricopeptide (TPR) repeat protein